MHDSEHPRKLRKFVKEHNYNDGGWWACVTIPEAKAAMPNVIEGMALRLKSVAGSMIEYDRNTKTYTLASYGATLAAAEVALQAAVGWLLPGYHL